LDGLISIEFNDGTSREATPDEIAAANKLMWIDDVYRRAEQLLDAQSAGYSAVETATWPQLQSEVDAYNRTGIIGTAMQTVLDRGRHTAATLSALLTPKITYQASVLAARDSHMSAIAALPADALDYNTTATVKPFCYVCNTVNCNRVRRASR